MAYLLGFKRFSVTKVGSSDYKEMAEHYGTAVIPARVRAPRDNLNFAEKLH